MVKLAVGALLAACSFHLLNKTSNTFHCGIPSVLGFSSEIQKLKLTDFKLCFLMAFDVIWIHLDTILDAQAAVAFPVNSYVFIGFRCFNPASVRFSAVFATQVFLRHQIETSVNPRRNSSLGGSPGRCGSGVSQVQCRPAVRAPKY